MVAEGVETAAQLAELKQLGCPRAQGYHLAPPLPAEAAAALLVEQIAPGPRDGRAASALTKRQSRRGLLTGWAVPFPLGWHRRAPR